MLTKFFDILNGSVQVKLQLGANPLRVYPYGAKLDANPRKPYALYGAFSATPYNHLADRVQVDLTGLQVDIYAETSDKAIACFEAIRNAIEDDSYIQNYSTPTRDTEDGLYHIQMEVDFHNER